MDYVTPADMKELYEEEILVQATNYSDRSSQVIDEVRLAAVCVAGSQIVDSYLLILPVSSANFSDRFLASVRTHAAHLALDHLASSDPQVREQAKESIDWLKSLLKLTEAELKRLVGNSAESDVALTVPGFTVAQVDEGRRWEVSFL